MSCIYHGVVYTRYDGIADVEYVEQDIYTKVEIQYIMTKSKIKDLLKDGESSEELASTKTCYVD